MEGLHAFAFKGNISEEVLKKLTCKNFTILESRLSSIDKFVTDMLTKKPSRILGLGMSTARGKSYLHLEMECSNQFKNRATGNTRSTLPIKSFIQPTALIKASHTIGTYYCNYVSYQILSRTISTNSAYAFIHIPKKFSVEKAADEINLILDTMTYGQN